MPSVNGDKQIYSLATILCEIVTSDQLDAADIGENSCVVEPGAPLSTENKSIAFSVIASFFLHAWFFYLAGNLWSLWIFGNNVEGAMGRLGVLAFYLIAGIGGSLAHVMFNRDRSPP